MERDMTFHRGDICWFIDPIYREENSFVLRGKRPAVIVSTDEANETSCTVVIAPMSTKIDKRLYPGQFDIWLDGTQSRIRCDQARVVDKHMLEAPYASLDDECMDALDIALLNAMGLENYIPATEEKPESPVTVAKLVRTF